MLWPVRFLRALFWISTELPLYKHTKLIRRVLISALRRIFPARNHCAGRGSVRSVTSLKTVGFVLPLSCAVKAPVKKLYTVFFLQATISEIPGNILSYSIGSNCGIQKLPKYWRGKTKHFIYQGTDVYENEAGGSEEYHKETTKKISGGVRIRSYKALLT